MSVAVRAPMFLYVAAFPLLHLAATVERFLATMRADSYETSSSKYGILASLAVVSTGDSIFDEPQFFEIN